MNKLAAVALVSSVAGTLGINQAASAACLPLTVANVSSSLANGQLAFKIGDEGFTSTPFYFDLMGQPNVSTGAFSGTMSESPWEPAPGKVFYPVEGTVTQVGTNGLGINFTFTTSPLSILLGETYTYSGAIAIEDAQCDVLMAGVYTTTTYTLSSPSRFGISIPTAHTSGPFPFSATLVGYVYE
jgi:hypothetical protein